MKVNFTNKKRHSSLFSVKQWQRNHFKNNDLQGKGLHICCNDKNCQKNYCQSIDSQKKIVKFV